MTDCDFVLHLASPFPLQEDRSVVDTAVNGTLRVLRAAALSPSVQKLVLTSSCAAVNEGHADEEREFDEQDWTLVDSPKVQSYARSKTEAERAAWQFVKDNGEPAENHFITFSDQHQFRLTVINPTFVVGPVLIDTPGASISTVKKFLNNEVPAIPPLQMGMVDVRDVAAAHLRALERPESDGQRILVTAQPSVSFRHMTRVIGAEFGSQGYRTPFLVAPYLLVWLWSFFDKEAGASLARLNRTVRFDNGRSRKLLDLDYRPIDAALVDMCYSLIERGIVDKRPGFRSRQAQ